MSIEALLLSYDLVVNQVPRRKLCKLSKKSQPEGRKGLMSCVSPLPPKWGVLEGS